MTTTFKPIAPQKYDNEKHFSCLVHTDSLLKKNEKVRVGLKRKQVKVLRLEKLVTDLKSQVSDLESSVTAGKAALLFSEEKCQDLRDEIAALRDEGRGEEKFHY